MNANELRVGNYFNVLGEDRVLQGVSNTSANTVLYTYYADFIGLLPIKLIHLKPIPLTEEWLLKFGFEKGSDIIGDCFYIELKNNDDFVIHIEDDNTFLFDDNLEIKHVHQLQNIYFALTQKELIYENRNKTS